MKFNNRNVFISDKARIGVNVTIGDNATIYDNVEVGANSIICNDSVLGEPLAAYYNGADYENPPTVIGPNSLVRSHCIIYAGCSIGSHFSTGHHVTIREASRIGHHCSIGTLCDIQGFVEIGDYCRLHSNVHISQTCSLAAFVFMYPFSVMANDPAPPSNKVSGGHIGRYSQVGVHAVILPSRQVGENCLVGAMSLVAKDIPDFSLAIGNPARATMDIRKYVALGGENPYPWMYRFDRGMPWEGIGFARWMSETSRQQCLS